jgi:hypothetical protein
MASASATVYDFARAYATGVPGLEPQVLEELHLAAGYSEVNPFWPYALPIPDGLAETTTTSHVLSRSKDGGPPVEDHTSFDEWRAIRADFQRAPLWMEFRSADLTGLNTNATELDLYAERPATGRRIVASFEITRVTNPPDDDGDGIQNACDVCPNQGHPPGGYRLPNGCPP